MIKYEKKCIEKLEKRGCENKEITKQLSIPKDKEGQHRKKISIEKPIESPAENSTNKEARKAIFCKNCGTICEMPVKGRKRIFCCDSCRRLWWNNHSEKVNRRATAFYNLKCKYCGKEFVVYGNKDRKYCSHNCYIKDRFWKKEDLEKIMECLKENKKPDFIPIWITEKLGDSNVPK